MKNKKIHIQQKSNIVDYMVKSIRHAMIFMDNDPEDYTVGSDAPFPLWLVYLMLKGDIYHSDINNICSIEVKSVSGKGFIKLQAGDVLKYDRYEETLTIVTSKTIKMATEKEG